jgi:hypothetical protein
MDFSSVDVLLNQYGDDETSLKHIWSFVMEFALKHISQRYSTLD